MSAYCVPADVINLWPSTYGAVTDAQVLGAIIWASSMVENITQRVLSLATYTEEALLVVSRFQEVVIKVRQWPIVGFSSLTVTPISTKSPQSLDITYIDFQRPPERLAYYSGPIPAVNGTAFPTSISRYTRGVVNYTYTAGFDPIPDDVALATAMLAQDFLMANANPIGATSMSVSAEGSSNSFSLGEKSRNQLLAEQILSKYVRWE